MVQLRRVVYNAPSVTAGDGLVLDGGTMLIDPTWNGQTAITEVGTLTTGVWHATAITPAYISGIGSANGIAGLDGTGKVPLAQLPSLSGGNVTSVFGRAGVVTAQTGDYTAANVGLGNVLNSVQLVVANNLSDLANAATARVNIGLGNVLNSVQLVAANNLSDLANAATARTNLGLGTAAVQAAGSANGVATLDGSGKLTSAQIPASLVGAVVYQGTWNASINSPALISSTGTKGFYYAVSVAGTTSLDGLASWNPGDVAIFNGAAWEKIDGQSVEVQSFNGRAGVVVPQTGDYTATNVGLGNVSNNLQLTAANNLSDLSDVATARANLLINHSGVSVGIAITTALPANTYNNGTAGVGATLTGNSNGLLGLYDGQALSVGEVVLVDAEGNSAHNGVYTVTSPGANSGPAAPYVFTRHSSLELITQVPGAVVYVINGNDYGGSIWFCNNTSFSSFGSGGINFTYVTGSLVAGTGISLGVGAGGNVVAVNLTAGTGISVSGATISGAYTAGAGITITGASIAATLTAGTGITVTGATISTNLMAGTGITIAGATISVTSTYMPDCNVVVQDFVSGAATEYPPASNTNAARGTALATAIAAATSGQVVWFGPGTFDLGTSAGGSSGNVVIPNGVTLKGRSRESTIITTATIQNQNCVITLGVNTTCEDFTLTSTGLYTVLPIGAVGSVTVTNAVLRRITVNGNSDGLYIWANPGVTGKCYDCSFNTTFDTVAMLNGSVGDSWEFYGCQFTSSGQYMGADESSDFSNVYQNNAVNNKTALLTLIACELTSIGGSFSNGDICCVHGGNAGAVTNLIGCKLSTQIASGSPTGAVADLDTPGTVNITGCYGSGTNGVLTTAGGGTFNFLGNLPNASSGNLIAAGPVGGGAGAATYRKMTTADMAARISMQVFAPASNLVAGSGAMYFDIPPSLAGKSLTYARATVITAGTTSSTTIQVTKNPSGANTNMLTTALTIAAATTSDNTATGTGAISTAGAQTVASGDQIQINVPTIASGTVPKGLCLTLEFQ